MVAARRHRRRRRPKASPSPDLAGRSRQTSPSPSSSPNGYNEPRRPLFPPSPVRPRLPPPASSLSSRRRAVYHAPSGMPLLTLPRALPRASPCIACVPCRPRSALPLLAPPRRPVPSPRHASAPAPATRRPLPPPPLLAASGAGAHAPTPAPFRPRHALASPSGRVRAAQPCLAGHSRRPTLGH
nr:protein transport protein sec31-like [Aegilops tauschii subsp. strangulata]